MFKMVLVFIVLLIVLAIALSMAGGSVLGVGMNAAGVTPDSNSVKMFTQIFLGK